MDVYNTDGLFVCSFGEGTYFGGGFIAYRITAANDGRVMVCVMNWHDCCVHIFSEDGHHLDKFQVQGGYRSYLRIAFHMLSEHVVIVGETGERGIVLVEIFTKDGVFVRRTETSVKFINIGGMTVTRDGRIAVVGSGISFTPKVLVI